MGIELKCDYCGTVTRVNVGGTIRPCMVCGTHCYECGTYYKKSDMTKGEDGFLYCGRCSSEGYGTNVG